MRLDNTKIRRWKDLVDAFIKQYKYNMDIAPDRTSLSNLEKKDKESIREYAQRWRESAAQVHPPLLDKEMVTLFADTLKAPYYEHVMGSSAQQFTDAVVVCEPPRKEASKERWLTMLEMTIGVGKTHSKTITVHPKLLTSTLHLPPKNPSPKTFKPKAKLEITKGSKNNYLHYRSP
jgi:hypothetical protein